MLIYIGNKNDEISIIQAGRVATRNGWMDAPSRDDNYVQFPPGTVVHINDLWEGNKGRLYFVSKLEELAAKCGAVIQQTEDGYKNAHFIVPGPGSGGARPGAGRPSLGLEVRFSVSLTSEQADWLDGQNAGNRVAAIRDLIDAAIAASSAEQ